MKEIKRTCNTCAKQKVCIEVIQRYCEAFLLTPEVEATKECVAKGLPYWVGKKYEK